VTLRRFRQRWAQFNAPNPREAELRRKNEHAAPATTDIDEVCLDGGGWQAPE
jgi:hypothetical protein